jgi:hypothetical protein
MRSERASIKPGTAFQLNSLNPFTDLKKVDMGVLERVCRRDRETSLDQVVLPTKSIMFSLASIAFRGNAASSETSLLKRFLSLTTEPDRSSVSNLNERRAGSLETDRKELNEGDSTSTDRFCNELEAIRTPCGRVITLRLNSCREERLCRTGPRPSGVHRVKLRLSSCFKSDKQDSGRSPATFKEIESFFKLPISLKHANAPAPLATGRMQL